jgi:hypothetical protein
MKNLKSLAIKCLLFTSPVIVLIAIVVSADPFRIYRDYVDYYKNNFVSLNREFVCLKLYERSRKAIRYNSFIFGSSRSLAFKVKNWELLLKPSNSKGFHFDGSGEGIYGIYNKIRYIDETGGELKSALIILDQDSLTLTKNRKGHLFISPPKLSKESKFDFYNAFTRPLLNLRFIIGYVDYSIFGIHRKYMEDLFISPENYDVCDNLTGDVHFRHELIISEDKEGYYKNLINKGIFYDRSRHIHDKKPVTRAEKELLVKMKEIFDKHRTDYRIVVSPLYDQIPLGGDHVRLLNEIFGSGSLYNHSGINALTESIYNYYEDSHYRPNVANEIMDGIYARSKLN